MSLIVRPAVRSDADTLMSLIRSLAEYEKLSREVVGTSADLEAHLFDEPRRASALLAETDDGVAGFALYFTNFSTFLTRPGLYLEDLYVRPECRQRGIGLALLRALARRAVAMGAGRMEWVVLDWNQPAIDFYDALGATPTDGWTTYRLSGNALATLADGAGPLDEGETRRPPS